MCHIHQIFTQECIYSHVCKERMNLWVIELPSEQPFGIVYGVSVAALQLHPAASTLSGIRYL